TRPIPTIRKPCILKQQSNRTGLAAPASSGREEAPIRIAALMFHTPHTDPAGAVSDRTSFPNQQKNARSETAPTAKEELSAREGNELSGAGIRTPPSGGVAVDGNAFAFGPEVHGTGPEDHCCMRSHSFDGGRRIEDDVIECHLQRMFRIETVEH